MGTKKPAQNPVRLPFMAVIESQRAVRRLRTDPVPAEIVERLIYAATRAPSGGNSQPWEFIAVTDSEIRRQLGDIYRSTSEREFQSRAEHAPDERNRRIFRDAAYLSAHIGEAPLLILVCVRVPPGRTFAHQLASVYPAVQNLLLAARAEGLGSVITTMHKSRDDDVKQLLGIPAGVDTVCMIPIGYPADPHSAFRQITNRRTVPEVLHWERF
jgi:nitroreductase